MADIQTENKPAKKKQGQEKEKNIVYFKAGMSDKELIDSYQAGADIRFNAQDFREIPDDVLSKLSREVAGSYYKVVGALEAMGLKPKHEVEMGTPFNMNAVLVYQYQPCPAGWIPTRIRVEDKEHYERIGYKYIKEAHTHNGKVTMVEMQVREADYKATLKRDAQVSLDMLKSKKQNWKDQIKDDRKFGVIPKFAEDDET